MTEIQEQLQKLQERWKSTHDSLQASPAVITPFLNGITLAQIDEVISTIATLMGRVRAPKGFNPSFHLAKAVSATSLPVADAEIEFLLKKEYSHFPTFIAALNQIVTSMHSLVAFSDKREIEANLSTELSEKLALLDTAQKELKAKLDLIEQATTRVTEAEVKAEEIDGLKTRSKEIVEEIEESLEEASKLNETFEEYKTNQAETKKSLDNLVNQNAELQKQLKEREKELHAITEKASKQEETIDALLPRAASAGLAYAFHGRVEQMATSKRNWSIAFILSIIGLLGMSLWIHSTSVASNLPVWEVTLHNLPFLAPLVWLGWFSAIQYGNSLRVQEDYAFKEATSNAFEGYRSHMEHLKEIDAEGEENALTLLSEKTIEILAEHPLRVFQRNERDASPSHSIGKDILARIKPVKSLTSEE